MAGPLEKSGIVWDLDGTLYEDPARMDRAWIDAFYQAGLLHNLNLDRITTEKKAREGHRRYGNAIRLYGLEYGIDETAFFKTILTFMDMRMIDPCHQTRDRFYSEKTRNMAVLTSAHREWALPVLRHIGLDTVFPEDRVVAYCDTQGALKSQSTLPFHQVADRMGRLPTDLVMVEDNLANLVTARDLGMTTVLITHGFPPDTPPTHVDFIVNKAYDVFDLIYQGQIPWHKINPEN